MKTTEQSSKTKKITDFLTVAACSTISLIYHFREALEEKYNDPSVTTNVFLCVFRREIDNSTLGRGTSGGACLPKRDYHGVIMGYDISDIYVARVNFLIFFLFSYQQLNNLCF